MEEYKNLEETQYKKRQEDLEKLEATQLKKRQNDLQKLETSQMAVREEEVKKLVEKAVADYIKINKSQQDQIKEKDGIIQDLQAKLEKRDKYKQMYKAAMDFIEANGLNQASLASTTSEFLVSQPKASPDFPTGNTTDASANTARMTGATTTGGASNTDCTGLRHSTIIQRQSREPPN